MDAHDAERDVARLHVRVKRVSDVSVRERNAPLSIEFSEHAWGPRGHAKKGKKRKTWRSVPAQVSQQGVAIYNASVLYPVPVSDGGTPHAHCVTVKLKEALGGHVVAHWKVDMAPFVAVAVPVNSVLSAREAYGPKLTLSVCNAKALPEAVLAHAQTPARPLRHGHVRHSSLNSLESPRNAAHEHADSQRASSGRLRDKLKRRFSRDATRHSRQRSGSSASAEGGSASASESDLSVSFSASVSETESEGDTALSPMTDESASEGEPITALPVPTSDSERGADDGVPEAEQLPEGLLEGRIGFANDDTHEVPAPPVRTETSPLLRTSPMPRRRWLCFNCC